ncbi:hypothetical protein JAAARDRAFT_595085 [Jaapia argillacea MUCL 33604]|uniref:NAD(P)-binding protein n=1 Tax=Jaapia argillacea MUCL 33604 TaxID=933084 RepID=A0A067QBT9_9AGAM|nr:hypothetical protein JAAARDRAFT_595085 [Jaapia argillacea MUCL 33604]
MFWRLFTSTGDIDRYHHGQEPWALVTGGSDGIGKGLCEVLAARGFNILIHGRSKPKLLSVLQELKTSNPNRQFEIVVADATDISLVDRVADAGAQRNLTVLVNNAGYTEMDIRLFADISHAGSFVEIDKSISIGVGWISHLTRALLPQLLKNEPSLVINIGSGALSHPPPFLALYTATKGYTLALTQCLRAEMKLQNSFTSNPAVEVQYHELHAVCSNSNREPPTLLRPSSHDMATAIVDAVGRKKLFVVPYWTHEVSAWVMWFMPERIVALLIAWAFGAKMESELQKQKQKAE